MQYVLLMLRQSSWDADQRAALAYMRSQVERFKTSQAHEIARLMGSLAFSRRLPRSPYAHLLEDSQWDTVARDFARHCCGLLGLVRSCICLLQQ